MECERRILSTGNNAQVYVCPRIICNLDEAKKTRGLINKMTYDTSFRSVSHSVLVRTDNRTCYRNIIVWPETGAVEELGTDLKPGQNNRDRGRTHVVVIVVVVDAYLHCWCACLSLLLLAGHRSRRRCRHHRRSSIRSR